MTASRIEACSFYIITLCTQIPHYLQAPSHLNCAIQVKEGSANGL